MKDVRDFSAPLSELASFAEREDWLYQAELRLADEFSLVATTFSQANPGAEVISRTTSVEILRSDSAHAATY